MVRSIKNMVKNLPNALHKIIWKGGPNLEIYFPKLPFGCIIVDK